MILEDVYTRLSGDSTITNVCSTRIYPHDQIPQNPTYPLITFVRIDGIRQTNLSNDGTIINTRLQVDAWASTRSAADSLLELARVSLTTATTFKATTISGPIDIHDPDLIKEGVIMDFSIWHN